MEQLESIKMAYGDNSWKTLVSNKGVQCPPSLSDTQACVYENQKEVFFWI